MLLHKAGREVEEIHFTNAEEDPVKPAPLGENPTAAQQEVYDRALTKYNRDITNLFEDAVTLLTRHFEPQKNVIYEREIFFDMRFESSDSVDSFVQRLRGQAAYCDFEDTAEDMLRDRLCARCPWPELKMEINKTIMASTVAQPFTLQTAMSMSITYEKCGSSDHKGFDTSCPGLNSVCERCGIKGHYRKMCKTRKERVAEFKARQVNMTTESSDDEDVIRAFHLKETSVCQVDSTDPKDESEYIIVHLGFAKIKVMIDSGSKKNILPKHMWDKIRKKFPGVFKEELRILCPYGVQDGTRVKILGNFTCEVTLENGKSLGGVKFYVADVPSTYEALLGKESALLLGVLRLGLQASTQVCSVSVSSSAIANGYPDLFKGVGRVNGISLTIPMKNNTPRIIQPQRRIAFHYLPPMEKILSDLLVHDVIERVPPDHVSKFVSPSHLVPKKDPNAFRLVVDMRQVNQFVEEVMYPIPLVEDCLAQFNGSVVFSKIDFNLFFHQHAIAPESRDVGTFSTPFGLFRYKVLFFGLSCSPELAYSTNATKSDEVLSTICTSLYSDNWPPSLKRYELIKSELGEVDGVLVKNSSLIIPKSLQTRVLTLAHEGHMGIVATKQRLRSKVWWDGIHKDAENWVRSCHPCQLVQEGTNSEPLQPSPLPKTCWEVVSCDYLGPLPTGDYLLVIVCYYSRYIEVLSTKKITAEKTIECLEYVFSRWGYPFVLVTDNGPCFIAHEFQEYLQNVGVAHRAVTPLWPQANGEVERQNRTILKRLKIAHSEGKKWKPELQSFLFAYRTTPHSVTRVAPLELMTGRKIKDKIPSLNFSKSPLQDEEVRDRDELAKAKNKEYADRTRHATPSSLVPGDSVLLQQKKMDKLSTRFESSPFTLLQKAGSKTWIQSEEGKVFQRNSSLVKPYVDRSSLFPEIGAAGPSVVNPTSPVQENQDVPSSEVPSASPSHATNPQPEAAGIPAASTTPHRPVRNRRLPSHLRDFILNCIYTF
ncbi:hypothetical protein FOCC_FOCC012356 [Frankliniella occidentalis]|nr:hypothetical protein FOCC_FOCC012356 [Frankliniella occidentalis]